MDEEYEELAKDMLNFFDATGQNQRFVEWMIERGHDETELRENMQGLEDL